MTIHKEGYKSIAIGVILFGIINIVSFYFMSSSLPIISLLLFIATLGLLLFLISFFRIPNRNLTIEENSIIAPADGKVVVIEEVQADEYFTDRRIQVSIFMSPLNVHVNRNPVSGEVVYNKYHKGKYLVAWHPKSSELNERTSIVIDNGTFDIMMRQIAGKLARRIVNYLEEGHEVEQGEQFGFIKFGSRVDLFLPLNTKLDVHLGQKVKGGVTIIGELVEA